MKYCNTCKKNKRKTQFTKRRASKDGLSSKCKLCSRAYDKSRAMSPERVKARSEYAATDAGKRSADKAKKKWASNNKGKIYKTIKLYRKNNPNKYRAHGMVAYAVKMKNLVPKPCEICADVKVSAHHDDYLEPLNVRWLCSKHHNQWHVDNGEGKNG